MGNKIIIQPTKPLYLMDTKTQDDQPMNTKLETQDNKTDMIMFIEVDTVDNRWDMEDYLSMSTAKHENVDSIGTKMAFVYKDEASFARFKTDVAEICKRLRQNKTIKVVRLMCCEDPGVGLDI